MQKVKETLNTFQSGKMRYKARMITCLTRADRTFTRKQKEIIDMQMTFYQNLYV